MVAHSGSESAMEQGPHNRLPETDSLWETSISASQCF